MRTTRGSASTYYIASMQRRSGAGFVRASVPATKPANWYMTPSPACSGAQPSDGVRDPTAFLNRIVRNLLVDRSRRRSARPLHIPIDCEAEVAVAPSQSDAIELEQMRQRYKEAVALLPPRMREVFVLHRVDGMSYKDIAARLDISIRTVEWHIAEAIVRISRGLDFE